MFTIGRFNIDDTQDHDAVTWDWDSDTVLRVVGNITAAQLHQAKALRRQLLGYPNFEEPVVPVTSTLDPEVDGYYVVESTNSELLPGGASYTQKLFPFTATLRRVSHAASASSESLLIGAERDNDHSALFTKGWHGVPNAVQGYKPAFAAMQRWTKPDAQGNDVRIYDDAGGAHFLGSARHLWHCPPANYYDSAVRIEQAQTFAEADAGHYHTLVGLQAPNRPVWWRLTNDMMTIAPGGSLDTDVGDIDVSWWDPTAAVWYTKTFHLGADNSSIQNRAHTFTVVRNTPHMCTVRLGIDASDVTGDDDAVTVEFTLRRGARFVEGYLSLYSFASATYAWQIRVIPNEAVSPASSDEAMVATSNDADGNKFILMCPNTHGDVVTGDGVLLTASALDFRFGIGMEVDGTGAAEPWRNNDLIAQYYAAQCEEARVSPP